MSPNTHLALFRFPTIFLVIYALFEMIRFKKLIRQSWYTPTKCVFLFVGTITEYGAFMAGNLVDHTQASAALVNAHATWAEINLWIFSVISLCYVLLFISKKGWFIEHIESRFERAGTLFPTIAETTFKIAPLAVVIGMFTTIVSSGLGRAVAYGQNIDPVVHFISHIFVK